MNRDIRTLKYLASMPFLDRLELAAVSDVPDRTMHDVVAGLKSEGPCLLGPPLHRIHGLNKTALRYEERPPNSVRPARSGPA